MKHFPPLDSKNLDVSKHPKIISRGALTQAQPTTERKNFRHTSDIIANNYSPYAKNLNTKSIYELCRDGSESSGRDSSNSGRVSKQLLLSKSHPNMMFLGSPTNSLVTSLVKHSLNTTSGNYKSIKLPRIIDDQLTENTYNADLSTDETITSNKDRFKPYKKKSFMTLNTEDSLNSFQTRQPYLTSYPGSGLTPNIQSIMPTIMTNSSTLNNRKLKLSINNDEIQNHAHLKSSFAFSPSSPNKPRSSTNSKRIDKLFSIILDHKGYEPKRKTLKFTNQSFSTQYKSSLDLILFNRRLSDNNTNTDIALDSSIKYIQEPGTVKFNGEDMDREFEDRELYSETIATNTHIEFIMSPKHDRETIECLNVKFPPWYTSTHGLTRPNSPEKNEENEQRYYRILNDCIEEDMLAQLSPDILNKIEKLIKKDDLIQKNSKFYYSLKQDIAKHYLWAIKKSIIDYVLREESEQKRLSIKIIEKVF